MSQSIPTQSNNQGDLRKAALVSLVLLGGAAAALTLANYLSKSPRVAVSSGSDAASLDEWLRKAAATLHQTRQRLVENVDAGSSFDNRSGS